MVGRARFELATNGLKVLKQHFFNSHHIGNISAKPFIYWILCQPCSQYICIALQLCGHFVGIIFVDTLTIAWTRFFLLDR